MELYHFSEEENIVSFDPRPAPSGPPPATKVVWTIDRTRSYKYLGPKDCPRVTGWADEKTTSTLAESAERLFTGSRRAGSSDV